jgi:hypothetical protein
MHYTISPDLLVRGEVFSKLISINLVKTVETIDR